MEERLLIVGAGLAGLMAALEATADDPGSIPDSHTRWPADRVLVIDKARSTGGRLATRRIGPATLDHGAQFFTARSDRFRHEVDRWLEAGVVSEWCRGFSGTDGHPRYRVEGGMRELARHLEGQATDRGIKVVTGHRVSALVPGPDRWTAIFEGADREPDDATAVVLTPPIPQSAAILSAGPVPLGPHHRSWIDSAGYTSVLALLTVLDDPPALPEPGALQRPDDATFTFVADNQAKGVSQVPAVTFHTAPALSARLWAASDAEVADVVLPAAAELVAPASIIDHQIKRWRYAAPVEPDGQPCLVVADRPGPLVLAGDAFAGAKVEGAFLSGLAAGAAVRPPATVGRGS
jgi:predicted NAD/FAD-dependent oxidoreductase